MSQKWLAEKLFMCNAFQCMSPNSPTGQCQCYDETLKGSLCADISHKLREQSVNFLHTEPTLNMRNGILSVVFFLSMAASAMAFEKHELIGSWSNSNTKTIYVFFPDGTMLFTFLNPPNGAPVENWHNQGEWSLEKGDSLKITYRYTSEEAKPFSIQTEMFRLVDGDLYSPHGPVYKRVTLK